MLWGIPAVRMTLKIMSYKKGLFQASWKIAYFSTLWCVLQDPEARASVPSGALRPAPPSPPPPAAAKPTPSAATATPTPQQFPHRLGHLALPSDRYVHPLPECPGWPGSASASVKVNSCPLKSAPWAHPGVQTRVSPPVLAAEEGVLSRRTLQVCRSTPLSCWLFVGHCSFNARWHSIRPYITDNVKPYCNKPCRLVLFNWSAHINLVSLWTTMIILYLSFCTGL